MKIFVIGTPIGNLKDITLRALEILKSIDYIIVESYPDSIKLLHAYDISPKKIIKYNDRNKEKVIPEIIDILDNHDVAFITSAGMPGVSDPGAELVEACYNNQVDVIPIPGVSALTTAVSVCGQTGKRIVFIGFLPRKKTIVKNLLQKYLDEESLFVFFESPYRLLKSLKLIKEFDSGIKVFIGKEMTKKFEKYINDNIGNVIDILESDVKLQKGEFTIILSK